MGEVKLSVGMGPANRPLPTGAESVVESGGTGFQSIASNSTIGGSNNLDLELIVGPHAGIHPDVKELRLRVKEMPDTVHSVTHLDPENHATFNIPLWVSLHWFQWAPAPREQGDPPSVTTRWRCVGYGLPNEFNSTSTARLYTTSLSWNTLAAMQGWEHDDTPEGYTTQLLGHNGKHEVEIVEVKCVDTKIGSPTYNQTYYNNSTLLWQSLPYGAALVSHALGLPPVYKTTVQNLTIENVSTNAGNADYFKFDPESTDAALTNPTITFTVADKEDNNEPHRYRWWVWVTPTRGEPNSVALSGIVSHPGSKTVTINQPTAPDTQEGELSEWGTYTFDIRVLEIKSDTDADIGEPWVDYRSTKLFIPPTYTDADGVVHPGHSMNFVSEDATDATKAEVSYYLEDSVGSPIEQTQNAVSGSVIFLDGEMNVKGTKPLQKEVRVPREDIEVYTLTGNEMGGDYRAMFLAQDGHAKEYRDHKSKPMMPANQKSSIKTFHIEDDWMVTPGGTALNPQARDRKVTTAFARPENKKLKTPWTKSNIIWMPINASTPGEVAGHFSPGDTGPTGPYMKLKAEKSYVADCDSYSTEGFTPPGGVSRFQHYLDRDGPADYWVGTGLDRSLMPGYTKAHAKARYVHVIGAGSHLDGDGNVSEDYLFGLTSATAGDIRSWVRGRWSFIFTEEIMKGVKVPTIAQAKDAIVSTTIHEIGHQFNTFDDHEGLDNSGEISGIAGENQAMQDFLDPATRAQGLKDFALYKGRLEPGVTVATRLFDFQDCVASKNLKSDYIFCEYHKHIIDTYTGW